MIDAKELRIGNWVEDYDTSHERFRVEEIIPGDEHTEGMWFVNGRWTDDLLPIPLTPEILGKCGFILSDQLYYNGLRVSLQFVRYDAKEPFLQLDSPFGSTTLRYVHELQNWFYCLTGQELEVKL